MERLLYGSGLRLMKRFPPHLEDLNFSQNQAIVRDGKGMVDHMTMLVDSLGATLRDHLVIQTAG